MKQILQYLIFPQGILYNKQNDTVRTNKVNSIFYSIRCLARTSEENKKDNLSQDCLFGSSVGSNGRFSNQFLKDLEQIQAFLSR